VIVDAGEVWWFGLPRVGRKPGVVCSRRALNLRVMPVVARITAVERERALPTAVRIEGGEVDGLDEPCFALVHDLFLAGPAAPALQPAGRLTARRLVELRSALAWAFALAER
jgi:mRNA-degrading endonuclease toxin of MazEF toxin-antitoxin module